MKSVAIKFSLTNTDASDVKAVMQSGRARDYCRVMDIKLSAPEAQRLIKGIRDKGNKEGLVNILPHCSRPGLKEFKAVLAALLD